MPHPIYVKEFVGTINENPWGRTFYVHSTHTSASDAGQGGGGHVGLHPRQPLKTLVQAYANCLAGDRIIIGPNHVETIIEATTFAKADVTIIGLGAGTARPTFTFTTVVGSGFVFSAGNAHLENLRFLCGIDAQTIGLEMTGDNAALLACDFSHSGAVEPLVACKLSGPYSVVGHCTATFLAAGMNTCLQFNGDADNIHIHNCHLDAHCATGVIENTTSGADSILIEENALTSRNSTAKPCILMKAVATGTIRWNSLRLLQGAQTGWITPGDTSLYENYGVNDDGETGILEGTPSV